MKQELPAGSKGVVSEPTVYDVIESYKSLRNDFYGLDLRLALMTKEVARLRRREGVPRWPFFVGLATPIVLTAAWRLLHLLLG